MIEIHLTDLEIQDLHSNTYTDYLNEFQTGKLPATLEDRYYKPTSSLDPFLDCLKCSFRASPVADAKHAVERIEKLTGIRLSESQSRRFMKALGLKLRKTAPVHGKCDHQLQFDFYTREMLPRLEEARLGERKVLFVDTAHFVLGAFLGLIWCFERIFLKTSTGRQRYNILGAIDSHNQEFTGIRTAIDRCLDDFEGKLKPELKSLLALNFQFFPNHKS